VVWLPDGAGLHRSYLYAPGSDARMVAKALRAGADAVILDLEDAVAPGEKATARKVVAEALTGTHADAAVHVRVNRSSAGFDEADVRAVVAPPLQALRLPKVEDPDHVRQLDELLSNLEPEAGLPVGSVALYPTVESALGAVRLSEILAASTRTVRAAFGAADFLADVGARGDEDRATLYVRSRLVVMSRAARVGPPIDSVHTRLDDEEGLRRAATRARALGFFGKSVIHPRQLPVVHEIFTPTADEVAWAQRVVSALAQGEAAGRGAVALDGEMIDEAVAARARWLLQLTEVPDDTP
jgi:citrate lyase subunit beta / citryl-CoA lyase